MKILNLTQHVGTPIQVEGGLFEPMDKKAVQGALTFTAFEILEKGGVARRARMLADYACGEFEMRARQIEDVGGDPADFITRTRQVLIGGLPALMGPLELALREAGLVPVYSHSERESVDTPQPDGSVRKCVVFNHAFFYEGAC